MRTFSSISSRPFCYHSRVHKREIHETIVWEGFSKSWWNGWTFIFPAEFLHFSMCCAITIFCSWPYVNSCFEMHIRFWKQFSRMTYAYASCEDSRRFFLLVSSCHLSWKFTYTSKMRTGCKHQNGKNSIAEWYSRDHTSLSFLDEILRIQQWTVLFEKSREVLNKEQ